MAKFKLTPVQQFRLQQAQATLTSVAGELNGDGRAKGDAYFAVIHLSSAARDIGEALTINTPPATPASLKTEA